MSGDVLTTREGAAVIIEFSNPTKLNALDSQMWDKLERALCEAAEDRELRCLVFRGQGGNFSSGADISEFASVRANSAAAMAFSKPVHRCFSQVADFPVPTLAAIQGVCTGGGLELAACCDLRICARGSRFGIPVNRIGAALCHAELAVLPNAAPPSVALELLLEGRILNAEEAVAKGLVTRLVEASDFDAEIAAAVKRITAGSPLAARWHKRFIKRLLRPEPLSSDEIAEGFACFDTEDYQRGYGAFVGGKRAEFTGR